MTFFIGIRCSLWLDNKCETEATYSGYEFGMEATSHDNREDILKELSNLEHRAREKGWKRSKKRGWICPICYPRRDEGIVSS